MVCIEALSTPLGAGTSDWPLPGTRGIPANTGQAAAARKAARNTATAGCFMTFSWCGYGYAETEVTPDITPSCHITGAGVHQITDRSLSRPPCFALDLRREYGPRRPEKVK
jgi:hypothetical protein